MKSKIKPSVVILITLLVVFMTSTAVLLHYTFASSLNAAHVYEDREEVPEQNNIIEVLVPFYIPPLDLRGYDLNHFEMVQWFLERLNYHRELYGIHPYALYAPAVVISVEHSLDQRNNNFSGNNASDGRTHQERHDRWMGLRRTKVTSASTSTHMIEGPFTEQRAHEIIETILGRERTHSFLMDPTYYYIGIGFSIQANGTGRLSITMASEPGKRAAHRARTPEEREIYRQEYLERVRQERGWMPPAE
jgi:hypothetical protein